MRSSIAALVLALVAALGAFAPAASAATDGPKVVIIVGATHGATASYRSRADKAYAEAIKYTSNVVKVYSPNATWSKVKAAAKGASIVVYLGHGNGWPSPYTYDPKYTTKDGFGLNASAGNGDSNNKYYGEPYVATLDLAPNAVVILNHLCYASGNSEPGDAAPSKTNAKKRVDNYAAGFLKAARAVIADGHSGAEAYIRAIFTTNQSIEDMWRTQPNFHDNEFSFASTRTSGAVAYMDPDSSSGGYYRSLVTKGGLTTTAVTGGFAVPGRAAAKPAGAPLYDAPIDPGDTSGAATPTMTLPPATRLRLIAVASGSGKTAVFEVEGLDDPSITGFVAAADLDPRDSTKPSVVSVAGDNGTFKPNGSGNHHLVAQFSETVDWSLAVTRGDTTYLERDGDGTTFDVAFDPAEDGAGDGAYEYTIHATDQWANGPTTKHGSFEIDSAGPTGTVTIDGGAAGAVVGTVRLALDATDAGSGVSKVRVSNSDDVDGDGILATGSTRSAADELVWTLAPGRGDRAVHVQWQDAAGNWSDVATDTIDVDPPDTTYHALPPTRLLDTRSNLPSGAERLTSGTPMDFDVAGRGGVPADAIAVTGNLTITGQSDAGYVSLGPIVGSSPATSTINFPDGDTRANGVVVPLDRDGHLEAVFKAGSGDHVHLVFDVTGYFTAGDDGSGYHSLEPARFLDTRDPSGPTAAGPLQPGVPLAIEVGGRSVGSAAIPADAVAVTGNLTVTGQTASGYLALTPDAQPSPATSTLNFPTGDTRANVVTVPLGADGSVHVVYIGSGTAHAILDVTGYYAGGAGGARWVPLAPARILDSRIDLGRAGAFKAGTPGSVTSRGEGGVGDDAAAFTGNLTVTAPTKAGYVSLTPSPTATPGTSTINFPKGETRANGVLAAIDASSGKVSLVYKAASGATVEILLDVTGYFH